MTVPTLVEPQTETFEIPPELMVDYDKIVTEDDAPVDSIFSEKQMRLLTEPLYTAWPSLGQERPFLALANVGLFYVFNKPPLVPDMMLSLDVSVPADPHPKKNRSYFMWEYGKAPEVVVEIVSNEVGGEDGHKFREYAWMGVTYYAIFDPLIQIQRTPLRLFTLRDREYTEMDTGWLPAVKLGLRLWQGAYEGLDLTWLRWYTEDGTLMPTGAELSAQERERADQERERAERAEQEIARLLARLREAGLDPTSE